MKVVYRYFGIDGYLIAEGLHSITTLRGERRVDKKYKHVFGSGASKLVINTDPYDRKFIDRKIQEFISAKLVYYFGLSLSKDLFAIQPGNNKFVGITGWLKS